MSSRPFADHLRDLEALNGEPSVTFPDSISYPVTERVTVENLGAAFSPFGTAETDSTNFPDNKLVATQIYGMDRHRRKVYRRYERVPGYAKVTHFLDSETNTPGTITRQLIATPSLPPTQTAGSLIEYTPLNSYCGYLTTTTLTNYASITKSIKSPEQFTFPRLITALDEGLVTGLNGNARIYMNWTERAEFSALTDTELVITYNTEANLRAAAPALEYAPVFKNLTYDGVFFNVSKGGVLNDAITVGPYTTGTDNPEWGYLVENAVTFTASTPSATDYLALCTGAFRVTAVRIEEWKYNLWRMTVKKVKLR